MLYAVPPTRRLTMGRPKFTADDLLAFDEATRPAPGMPCPVCALPERPAIDEAKRRVGAGRLGGTMIQRWLISECGYAEAEAPNRRAFDRHFTKGHHEVQA